MISLFCLVLGACLGSFIPCFAERRQKHLAQSGRSYCMNCHAPIAPLYLIPIIGYFLSKGHCRHCQAPIPKSLVLFEIFGALVGLLITSSPTQLLHPILQLVAIAFLLLLSLDDWHTQWIHDTDLLAYTCLLIADSICYDTISLPQRIIGSLLVSLPLYIIYRWKPQSLGSGDIIFMAISGFYLGPTGISYAFLIGILSSLGYSLWLIRYKNATVHTAIPLIPFLAIGVTFLIILHNHSIFFL